MKLHKISMDDNQIEDFSNDKSTIKTFYEFP